MRIACVYADPEIPVFGCEPSSLQIQEFVLALRARGVEVVLFAANGYGPRPYRMKSLAVHVLPRSPQGAAARERHAYKANAQLQAALEYFGPFDAVYERYSRWSYSAMEYAQIIGAPGLLEIQLPPPGEPVRRRDFTSEFAAQRVAEWVFKDASLLLPGSCELCEQLLGLGVDPQRIITVRHEPPWSFVAAQVIELAVSIELSGREMDAEAQRTLRS